MLPISLFTFLCALIDAARAKNELSHAGGNIGGYSVSADGVAQNDPNRKEGSWNQV